MAFTKTVLWVPLFAQKSVLWELPCGAAEANAVTRRVCYGRFLVAQKKKLMWRVPCNREEVCFGRLFVVQKKSVLRGFLVVKKSLLMEVPCDPEEKRAVGGSLYTRSRVFCGRFCVAHNRSLLREIHYGLEECAEGASLQPGRMC